VLVAVPALPLAWAHVYGAKLFAKPLLIGEPETGAVGSPKAHAFPPLGFDTKRTFEQRNVEPGNPFEV